MENLKIKLHCCISVVFGVVDLHVGHQYIYSHSVAKNFLGSVDQSSNKKFSRGQWYRHHITEPEFVFRTSKLINMISSVSPFLGLFSIERQISNYLRAEA